MRLERRKRGYLEQGEEEGAAGGHREEGQDSSEDNHVIERLALGESLGEEAPAVPRIQDHRISDLQPNWWMVMVDHYSMGQACGGSRSSIHWKLKWKFLCKQKTKKNKKQGASWFDYAVHLARGLHQPSCALSHDLHRKNITKRVSICLKFVKI